MIKSINSLDTGGQLETDVILAKKKINEIIYYINNNEIKNNNFISKDRIRKIIENSSYPDFAIQKIKELLEE